jgi:hypothetical protein
MDASFWGCGRFDGIRRQKTQFRKDGNGIWYGIAGPTVVGRGPFTTISFLPSDSPEIEPLEGF